MARVWMRNYGAMLDAKLLKCINELQSGHGDAADQVRDHTEFAGDFDRALRDNLNKALLVATERGLVADVRFPARRPVIEHPIEVPPLTWAVEWNDDGDAFLVARTKNGARIATGPLVVGQLRWFDESGEWMFYRFNAKGEAASGGHLIDVDPEQTELFREQEVNIRKGHEAVRDPLLAELRGRRRAFRDETRDLAGLGAKVEARKWLPWLIAELELPEGCTGFIDPEAGMLKHDAEPCPIHEGDAS